jgi:hypothetical protein
MRTNELIRTVNGAEVPAPGRWTAPASHVDFAYDARAGFLRRVRGRSRSVTGTVDVGDDPFRLELELRIDATSRPGEGPGLGTLLGGGYLTELTVRAFVIEPSIDGLWRTCGEVEFDGVVRPLPIDIQYGGVYSAGDEARAWFVLRASLSDGVIGQRRNGPVEVIADILAVAPSPATAP